MNLYRSILFFLSIVISNVTFASDYDQLEPGSLQGKLLVQWLEPDVFLFIPDKLSPLSFTRHNGDRITPKKLLTDGGTIPRPIWVFRSYSPWGYAPAFVIHDWIFHIKNCEKDNFEDYTLEIAAEIMGEVIKTMMESNKVEKDPLTVRLMTAAVSSPIAQTYWENGKCKPAPPAFTGTPLAEYTINFD